MAYIKYKDENVSFDLEPIEFIKVFDMYTFHNLFINSEIEIFDEINFNNVNNIVITPIAKTRDIFSFTRSNFLGKWLLEYVQNEQINLFNTDSVNKIVDLLKTKISSIEANVDIDILKVLNLLIEIDEDKLLDKQEFMTMIKFLEQKTHNTKILLFNQDWIDEEVIEKIYDSNIKTIIIFNESSNIAKILNKFKENILILDSNKVCAYDYKKNVTDDYLSPNIFLKL